jgi:L-lactate dehydrogenase
MGESVESQFVAWSNAGIGTTPLHLGLSDELTQEFNTDVENHTHGAACAISVVKGFTTYGIGNVAASICKYICLSMPAVIGRKGVLRDAMDTNRSRWKTARKVECGH